MRESKNSIFFFRLIYKLLDVMRCISKMFHTFSWYFVFVISNFVWSVCLKNVKLTSKCSKFNWKFNSNVLMSIQGVSVSDSAGKFTNFTFHLIKSVAVTQTRPFWFSWFSSGLCESAILIFFLYLHCSAICHIALLAQIWWILISLQLIRL